MMKKAKNLARPVKKLDINLSSSVNVQMRTILNVIKNLQIY